MVDARVWEMLGEEGEEGFWGEEEQWMLSVSVM